MLDRAVLGSVVHDQCRTMQEIRSEMRGTRDQGQRLNSARDNPSSAVSNVDCARDKNGSIRGQLEKGRRIGSIIGRGPSIYVEALVGVCRWDDGRIIR